jgi:hypothetical protein
LKGLNIGKLSDNPNYWVACNSQFLFYCNSDSTKSDHNLLLKLVENHYWIVKNKAIVKSKDYKLNDFLMSNVKKLISYKKLER